MKNEIFFTSPVNAHLFTDSFTNMCERLHFRNLAELLAWPVSHLLKLDGFTYHHYQELWKFLERNDCRSQMKF